MFGHLSKSPSCFFKLEVNGLICHPFIVFKNLERYVILVLDFFFITITFFDLWMFRFGNDMFALSMNSQWIPWHSQFYKFTMGNLALWQWLFETTNTIGVVMATKVKGLLSSYNLLEKLITYMKDESGNLSTLAWTFTFIVFWHFQFLGKVHVLPWF